MKTNDELEALRASCTVSERLLIDEALRVASGDSTRLQYRLALADWKERKVNALWGCAERVFGRDVPLGVRADLMSLLKEWEKGNPPPKEP